MPFHRRRVGVFDPLDIRSLASYSQAWCRKSFLPFLLILLSIQEGQLQAPGRGDLLQPIIVTKGRTYKLEGGSRLTLPCQVKNLGPMVLIWKKEQRVLTAGELLIKRDSRMKLVGTDLIINGVTTEDAGRYTCEIEADMEYPIEVTHTLEILVAPSLRRYPPSGEIIVKKGSTVSLKCVASGHPPPKISWSRQNDQLTNRQVSPDGSALTLPAVSRHQAGVYICQADNGVGGPVNQNINLVVFYSPEVSVEASVIHGGVGHTAELSCVVYSKPLAEVLWYKDTMLLENDGNHYFENKGTLHKLVIRKVEQNDFANYSCSSGNKFGRGRAYIQLKGNPTAPVFKSREVSQFKNQHTVTWITESYSTVNEYRLLYRKVPEDPKMDVLYAWNNIIVKASEPNSLEKPGFLQTKTFLLENLWPDSTYESQVQAHNQHGWSDMSKTFKFDTRGKDSAPNPQPQTPKDHQDPISREYSLASGESSNLNISPIALTLCFFLIQNINKKLLQYL